MPELLTRIVHRAASRLSVHTGLARKCFAAHRGCIRVLTYHGVVPDELADRPWVPSHYVTVSQFERQMAILSEFGPVRPLGEAMRIAQADPQAAPAVCVTFDDGMADNVTLALPILREAGHRATFFLATAYMNRHRHLPNDIIRMLRPLHHAGMLHRTSPTLQRIFDQPGYAKTRSASDYMAELFAIWADRQNDVDPAGLESLQTMTWEQARALHRADMEIGAHTVNHVILSHEDAQTRRLEIIESIARVRTKFHEHHVPFSYPNGLAGDYDACDTTILKAIGTPYATTESPGWNDAATPRLELRRNCIGLHCGDRAFLEQLYGVGESHRRSS
jgi:peptidoglycan/xylan/chitin deacetylase (PgdA/CDA1 family)